MEGTILSEISQAQKDSYQGSLIVETKKVDYTDVESNRVHRKLGWGRGEAKEIIKAKIQLRGRQSYCSIAQ